MSLDGTKIRIGISSCLLGENVRYDGEHSLDRLMRDTLGKYVEYVPVCPETEAGFSTPREPCRLVEDKENPRFIMVKTGVDHTNHMRKWSRKRAAELELEREGLSGFIFKSKSPSCGMERVKVFGEKGVPAKKGVGVFARAFMERFPLLPVEDDGRLHDPGLRENFIERIFVLGRWRNVVEKRKTRGNLVTYHTQHKLLIMSHSRKHLTEMGRVVGRAKDATPGELYPNYQYLLLEALKLKASVRKHVSVLQHVQGYFKRDLTADEKKEIADTIDAYREGNVPLIVPITLLNHYVRKYDEPYLKEQVYLRPHPLELKLRNHV